MFCGLLPLALGVGIFAAWYVTRSVDLALLGLLNIGVGLLLVAIGVVSLLVYVWRARAGDDPAWKGRSVFALLIMLANFPAAAGLVVLADYIASAYVVTVSNQSSWPLVDLAFQSGDRLYTFGTVSARSQREETFHFPQERELRYSTSLNGKVHSDIFDGYVSGQNNRARLDVSETGDLSVRRERF